MQSNRGNEEQRGKHVAAVARGAAGGVRRTLERLDHLQQGNRFLAVPFAVVRKFGDDQAGNLAALLAYYGFFSLFPLLLVLVTVLGFVLAGHAELQQRVLDSALAQFPVIGDQIGKDVGSITGSGVALAIGLVGTLWGGLGITQQAQNAMNTVWGMPRSRWPNFWLRLARGLGVLAVLGLGALAATLLSGLGTVPGLNALGRVLPFAGTLLLNLALFLLAFKVLTSVALPWRRLLPGTVLAAVAWTVLQVVGGYFVTHQTQEREPGVRHARPGDRPAVVALPWRAAVPLLGRAQRRAGQAPVPAQHVPPAPSPRATSAPSPASPRSTSCARRPTSRSTSSPSGSTSPHATDVRDGCAHNCTYRVQSSQLPNPAPHASNPAWPVLRGVGWCVSVCDAVWFAGVVCEGAG
jgi:membrane protein